VARPNRYEDKLKTQGSYNVRPFNSFFTKKLQNFHKDDKKLLPGLSHEKDFRQG